ncbi:uncharacterized protein CCOS01_02979 [Colletotrichum costaricense]|uniref:Uncharacterized protein n=1 Tax=Colletotrichum costaricense TaxID=1209916 RepID=A0AAI9Z4F4_9PEZI|nr:uncharacterized protein CCOS01_02979 [Colletotrichum costaricense]KAK1534227.1 hypothetical protein CCOS01_02979 [Colletotrichum costaricense]
MGFFVTAAIPTILQSLLCLARKMWLLGCPEKVTCGVMAHHLVGSSWVWWLVVCLVNCGFDGVAVRLSTTHFEIFEIMRTFTSLFHLPYFEQREYRIIDLWFRAQLISTV